MTGNSNGFRRAAPFALMLLLGGCGSDFQPGAYVDPKYGTTYEFGEDGQGRLIGGVPGTPGFSYEVKSDTVVATGEVRMTFKRIDENTLERPDGTRLVLRKER